MLRCLLGALVVLVALGFAPSADACGPSVFFGQQAIVVPPGVAFGFGGCGSGFPVGFHSRPFVVAPQRVVFRQRFSDRPVPQTALGAAIQAFRDRRFGR